MLTPNTIADLLQPYVATSVPPAPAPDWPRIYTQLAQYLELILKWNARVNLTSIRSPEEIARRHFGESLFAGLNLGPCSTLLDFGSGAGFPGLPIQLVRPDVAVTLAEARNKKAAFLREVARTLALPIEVFAERVESMPAARGFDVVTLRAVDNMDEAVQEASNRASSRLLILGTRSATYSNIAGEFEMAQRTPIPHSTDGELILLQRR